MIAPGWSVAPGGVDYDTCSHASATWRDLGAGGFAMACDPCLEAEDAALSFVASGDASAVCGDCGEDLMGGGPHAAGCPADECGACGHRGGREATGTGCCDCGCHWPQEA